MFRNVNNKEKVMDLIFRFPTRKFHVREISRIIKVSAPTVSSVVSLLAGEGIVIRRKTKVIDEIYGNIDSEIFRIKKRTFNIEGLYQSGLIGYIQRSNINTIVLFGSYPKGEDIERSDIDIFVIGRHNKFDLSVFEKKLNRKIDIHQIDLSKTSKEFKNNLINGIVLEGYLKLL